MHLATCFSFLYGCICISHGFERTGPLFQILLVHSISPPVSSSLMPPVSSCFFCINRVSIFLSLKGKVEKFPLQIPRALPPPCPVLHIFTCKAPCLFHLLTSHSLLHLPSLSLVFPVPCLPVSLYPPCLCCP